MLKAEDALYSVSCDTVHRYTRRAVFQERHIDHREVQLAA